VRYLLDVNALLAFGLREHRFHARVAVWIKDLSARNSSEFATCAITELGFLRVSTHSSAYGYTLNQGKALLAQLKRTKGLRFAFITDDQSIARLPAWVERTNQITDGHLAGMAKAHGALLATLDEKIPGSFVIPS
jgi:predicted nucleic acid-binding protein